MICTRCHRVNTDDPSGLCPGCMSEWEGETTEETEIEEPGEELP